MALPYPTKVVLPFDIATAQDMNERHANDVALANGSGLDDGAVTPEKRSGGFNVGTFQVSATGSKVITGVGFTPKYLELEFLVTGSSLPANDNANNRQGRGATDGTNSWATAAGSTSSTHSTTANATNCIIARSGGATTILAASLTSFDSDGFTLNVGILAAGPHMVGYKAYA